MSVKSNFFDLQKLVLRTTLETGDVFILKPFKIRSNNPYGLKLQVGDKTYGSTVEKVAWNSKKKMSLDITNEYLDRIYGIAMQNGALGGKITGAGGGGRH